MASWYSKGTHWKKQIDGLKQVYYRATVAMNMKKRIVGNKKIQVWVFDKDFLRKTLMWSQTSKFGPWLPIPWGCPTLIAKKHKKKIVNECVWYHRIGKEIKSVANYASFLPNEKSYEDASEHNPTDSKNVQGTTVDVTEGATGNPVENWKKALTEAEAVQKVGSVRPKSGIARCLLKKIQTISETKTVQCFFKGLTEKEPSNGWKAGLPTVIGEDGNPVAPSAKDIIDCKYMMSGHEHGKICYQTIQLKAKSAKVTTACEDFIDFFPSAQFYGKCVSKCQNAFKRNNGNWGYNHRLHRGWGKISESWIEQHEDADGHDVQETPNHRRNNVDKVNERRYKYEDHVMSHRSHWRELITRGELVDGADKDDQSTNSAQETSDVKIFSWSASDLGAKSYPFCQLGLWYSWATCDPVQDSTERAACSDKCHDDHRTFKKKMDAFKKASYGTEAFIEAQVNYDRVLHNLNRMEGQRFKLSQEIKRIDHEIALVDMDTDPELVKTLKSERSSVQKDKQNIT